MTTLAELQAQFQSFLLGRGRDIEALTVGTGDLPAAERLGVYAEAYRLRLIEVLADDFPGLGALVGNEAFDALASAYIDACPSTHPSVRWFGRHLESFLRNSPAYRTRPALAEMAAFEWAQGEVMDAADSRVLAVEELAALAPAAWPEMRIIFQSALRRLDLHWNVPAVWRAVDQGDPPSPLKWTRRAVSWLLWRRGVEVHWRSLDGDECHAIDAARRGEPFGEICQGLLARTGDEEVPLRAAGFLKRWASDELVARIDA